jgi:hypothetical protein
MSRMVGVLTTIGCVLARGVALLGGVSAWWRDRV